MVNKVTSYKILAIAAIAATTAVAVVGYWFADEKSEPVYLSKIDKLMFDKNNKAPKFVLTLPKPEKLKEGNKTMISADSSSQLPPPAAQTQAKEETLETIIAQIPNLNQLPLQEPTQKLRHVEIDETMSENLGSLVLPKIAEDGRKPWNEYGKSVGIQPNFKKVALIIKGLGLDPLSMERIVKSFDSEVSVSISPYASDTGNKLIQARQSGHETYADLLLSSTDFLKSDNGPMSMSITITKEEALLRLQKSLSTGAPVGGVVVNDGLVSEDNAELLNTLLEELQKRGLLLIDATSGDNLEKIAGKGLARRKADIVIDKDFRKAHIDAELKRAEEIAFSKGQVVVVIDPKPVAVVEVYKWIKSFSPQVSYEEAKTLELTKPFALVPISNLVME